MEHSKNERAGQLLGFRESGTAVLEPSELGYRCPVCKNVPMVNHEYDERLTWSEYNSFLWCEVCNRDFPSCLCLQDIERAIEIFLDSVETAAPRWISVEVRLPEPGQKVLRCGKTWCSEDDYYDVGELISHSGDRWADWGVTHWMPLPSPPQGDCCDAKEKWEKACKEWLRGCTWPSLGRQEDCAECTKAFHNH